MHVRPRLFSYLVVLQLPLPREQACVGHVQAAHLRERSAEQQGQRCDLWPHAVEPPPRYAWQAVQHELHHVAGDDGGVVADLQAGATSKGRECYAKVGDGLRSPGKQTCQFDVCRTCSQLDAEARIFTPLRWPRSPVVHQTRGKSAHRNGAKTLTTAPSCVRVR